jgi:hypothetical protein
MAGVFISYRRDDTAGYAGRLFDSLVRRFGGPAVFMDLTDIAPGSDFVETIDRAVGSCDVLLVLIGRNWLTSADGQGRSRLEDPQDFIRREVSTALGRNILVVPVLVQGARMPTAEQLPEDLKKLARREAIELSDSRWDTDVARLEEAISRISSPRPATSAAPQPRSRRDRLVPRLVIAGIAAAIVIVTVTQWASSRKDSVPRPEPAPTGPEVPRTSRSRPDQSASGATSTTETRGPGPAYSLNLPAVASVKVNKQEFQILAVRLEPRGGDSDLLSFLVRLTDRNGDSDAGDILWDDSFRLVVPEGRKKPVSGLSQLVGPLAARDGEVRFEVPRSLSKTELEISKGDDTTRIPVDLRDRNAIPQDGSVDRFGLGNKPLLVNSVARLPVALSSGGEAAFDGVIYKVLSASLDRYNVEKAAVTVTLRCTVDRRSNDVNFWDRNIRLVVDGVPRAPDESVNEVVPPGTSKDAPFVFLIGQRPDTLKLTIRYHRTTDEIPIDVPKSRP